MELNAREYVLRIAIIKPIHLTLEGLVLMNIWLW